MAENKTVWLEDALAAAKTPEEREQILKEHEAQKLAEAARKEQARFDSPTMIDKFMNGITALKKKMFKDKTKDKNLSQTQQHTR